MFEIRTGTMAVGNAEVKRVGLYYHITCTCQPPSNEIHRIIMRNGNVQKDLGICVPSAGVFTLFKRIPVKCFPDATFTFELIDTAKESYIVRDNMPFAHLDKLESARLQNTNGQLSIIIDPVPDPQDSGQTREHLQI